MNEAVRQLAADSGALHTVAGRRSAAGYEALELIFERATLRLTCNPDTDEIVITAADQVATGLREIRDDGSLCSLLGKVISQAWIMVNDRDYQDGFQLRCIDLGTRDESCCQFEVAASAITVARVTD
jgi:hypothetical protein